MKVVILHNRIEGTSTPDQADVLKQVKLVSQSLNWLGHQIKIMEMDENLRLDIQNILQEMPDVVFNLVESVFSKNELLYLAPALLQAFKIPYTGASVESLFLTTNKVLAKDQMKQAGIPTPHWYKADNFNRLSQEKKYILKPIREDGSVGLDAKAVFKPSDTDSMRQLSNIDPSNFFIEEYIEGKEFNISLLTHPDGPEVLSPAEMLFIDFPEDKEKIVSYDAKWNPNTFEYGHTRRIFHRIDEKGELIWKMRNIALQCWEVFGLKGYARVDIRVDREGNPFVLEINANPCISPDSGFITAALETGYTPRIVIKRILTDIN